MVAAPPVTTTPNRRAGEQGGKETKRKKLSAASPEGDGEWHSRRSLSNISIPCACIIQTVKRPIQRHTIPPQGLMVVRAKRSHMSARASFSGPGSPARRGSPDTDLHWWSSGGTRRGTAPLASPDMPTEGPCPLWSAPSNRTDTDGGEIAALRRRVQREVEALEPDGRPRGVAGLAEGGVHHPEPQTLKKL